ncbi:unnamed protein product [Caenorhabditis sp. 36 PRJEB53466]|nr:unnamed protein product [Caenorhabditis sp. 36 PRJEB53466]
MLNRRRARAGSEDGSRGSSSMSEEEPEPFEEMYSIFRIVAMYELMMHGQWQYVTRFLKHFRPELVLGMYIGSAFELIRFICVIILAIVLALMRIAVLSPLQSDRIIGNITWISTMNSLAFWVSLILCLLIVGQFAVYQCRTTPRIVIVTTVNFCFSVILICTIINLAILKANGEDFVKEGIHKKLLYPPETMKTLSNYQMRMKCCGINGPEDYRENFIIRYRNPLTNKTEEEPLTREFALDGRRFFSLPISCCRRIDKICSQRNLTDEEMKLATAYHANGDWHLMLTYFVMPESGTYHTKGCLTEFVESVDSYATILIVSIVIFTIFTGLTVGFVIVLLLYHDGVGHIVSDLKMFGVERNTGVHFLMSLDMAKSDFQDDFSLIEFLRKSDLDNFLAGDRLKEQINGRKEAERM